MNQMQLVSGFTDHASLPAQSHAKKNNEGIFELSGQIARYSTLGTLHAWGVFEVFFKQSEREELGMPFASISFMRSLEFTPALSGGNRSQHSDRDDGQTAPPRAHMHQAGGVR